MSIELLIIYFPLPCRIVSRRLVDLAGLALGNSNLQFIWDVLSLARVSDVKDFRKSIEKSPKTSIERRGKHGQVCKL